MYIQKNINNIDVISYKMSYVNSVYVGIWIKVGSRYENILDNGISHFIEHMVFKGSINRSAKQIAEDIDSIGGQLNGFTGKELTCFYIKVLNSYVKKGIDILFEMVFDPLFAQDDIEKEKSVVIEEIHMNNDSPEDLAYDMLLSTIWKGNPLSYPVLGNKKTIDRMNKNSIINYYKNNYIKSNIIISIAGNFDDSIFDILDKKTINIKDLRQDYVIKTPNWNKGINICDKDFEQISMCLSMPAVKYSFDNIYPLSIVNNAIGGGMSSRLFQKVREDKGLVYSIYTYPSLFTDTGIFTIFASTSLKNLKEVYELIIKEIYFLKKNGLSKNEFEKFKEQLRISVLMDIDSIGSRMTNLGKSKLLLGRIYTLDDVLNKINSITYEEINSILKVVLDIDNLSVSLVGKMNNYNIGWLKSE